MGHRCNITCHPLAWPQHARRARLPHPLLTPPLCGPPAKEWSRDRDEERTKSCSGDRVPERGLRCQLGRARPCIEGGFQAAPQNERSLCWATRSCSQPNALRTPQHHYLLRARPRAVLQRVHVGPQVTAPHPAVHYAATISNANAMSVLPRPHHLFCPVGPRRTCSADNDAQHRPRLATPLTCPLDLSAGAG